MSRSTKRTSLRQQLVDLKTALEACQLRLRHAQAETRYERLQRVSAQRGLVAYMQEHGLADRIGYDPDKDPVVRAAIKTGEIPGQKNAGVLEGIATEIVAARAMG